ncbi:MAG: PepSY domain-containing protein [Cellvibrionaceae bacterium]
MFRLLILIHRYLGIAIGLVMVIWCLSGFVMMYMPYPSISQQQSLDHLTELDLSECCDSQKFQDLKLVDVNRFKIEMLAGEPIIRFSGSSRNNPIVDLRAGRRLDGVDKGLAQTIIKKSPSINKEDELTETTYSLVEKDQWTVTRFYQRHRPFHKFSEVKGKEQTEWYVSSSTGEIFQQTTSQQRFWNYLGAIPHWLYPTALRQHDELWEITVIIISGLGVFLTVFGIVIGLQRFRKLSSGRRSPYRTVGLWHHYFGLVFGIFVLTWVFSGFISMNPGRLFDLSGGFKEREKLQGIPLSIDDVKKFVDQLPTKMGSKIITKKIKRIEGYALRSQFYILLIDSEGQHERYNGNTFEEQKITSDEKEAIIHSVREHDDVLSQSLLTTADAYYYNDHDHGQRKFPVYKVVLNNPDTTHFYINAVSGEIAGFYSQQQRWFRWIFSGLHQLDFNSTIRSRPFWDILVWLLLIGVTVVSVTGTYMGLKRLLKNN